MVNKEKISILKSEGFLLQNDKKHFSVRILSRSGNFNVKEIEAILTVIKKYGNDRVGITSRMSVEIPWINGEDIEDLKKELDELGLRYGGTGKRVRPLVACKGSICLHGNINTQQICAKLDDDYFAKPMHSKCKIGIAGCPNNCIKANLNDIGIMGVTVPNLDEQKCVGCGLCVSVCRQKALVIENKKVILDQSKCVDCGNCTRVCRVGAFTAKDKGARIYIGGRFGRSHSFGCRLGNIFKEDEIYSVVEKIFDYYKENGVSGERICHMMNRIGKDEVVKNIEDKL